MTNPHPSEEVLAFWLTERSPEDWYKQDAALDEEITTRFMDLWEKGERGELSDWTSHPQKALALVILLDQFPRNMFRGQARAFATDLKAKSAACYSIENGWDMRAAEPERQFFYMPFCHSEILADQDHCVRLMKERMPETGQSNILHARAHREIIRTFGRFPFRNEALGRQSSVDEQRFMEDGGYGKVVSELEAAG
ncbi:DUF924 family protein [Rhodophyticola porphyridii]|uniref:DUF924 domain-containing protein n=1 Tax=Rhodophyticola porphyridii TaxID=1852017 RepID=A0A3L9Y846_9RHOB|nr:DUF924 family protein [Rhodophyticola porphyridii]RMA42473.1 DUF924 domain-containing protein [Rhodophyticola porphyridii]